MAKSGPTPLDRLTPMQRAYALVWLDTLGQKLTQADLARLAGSTATDKTNSLTAVGSKLHGDTEEARAWLEAQFVRGPGAGHASRSFKTLCDLRDDPKVPAAVRRQAAKDILEIVGFGAVTKSEHSVTVNHTLDGMSEAELRDLAQQQFKSLNPEIRQQLAGLLPPPTGAVVDASFEEIPPVAPKKHRRAAHRSPAQQKRWASSPASEANTIDPDLQTALDQALRGDAEDFSDE